MPQLTRKEYKSLEALLRRGRGATSIAKLLVPEGHLNHKLYCGGTLEACRKHPLALIAKPGMYSLHMSPSKMRLRIHIKVQPLRPDRYQNAVDAVKKDDSVKLSRARESLFDFLGDQSGFVLGGDGLTRGLVALARPGSYYCERIEDDVWIWMEVRDEDNLLGALYLPDGPRAARSVSNGSESVYSGSSQGSSSISSSSSSAAGARGQARLNVPEGFSKAKGWWSVEGARSLC